MILSNRHLDFLFDKDLVFHYTKASTALEHILFEKRIRLSPRKNVIDPVEKKNTFGKWIDNLPADYDSALNHPIKDSITRMLLYEGQLHKSCKQVSFCKTVLSTTRIKDNLGCVRPRMWDQYGDNYKGVCLIFSKKELMNENAESKIIDKDVEYLDYKDLEKVKPQTIDYQKFIKNPNSEERMIKQNIEEAFFIKHNDYKDENEFRIISFDKNQQFVYLSTKKSLKGILYSEHCNEYTKEQLNKFQENQIHSIKLMSVRWTNSNFEIWNTKG